MYEGFDTRGRKSKIEIRNSTCSSSILSQEFVNEISPCNGRHSVAHGASRGSERTTLAHAPLSRPGGRGGTQGGEGVHPTADAVGYRISPLWGFRIAIPMGANLQTNF